MIDPMSHHVHYFYTCHYVQLASGAYGPRGAGGRVSDFAQGKDLEQKWPHGHFKYKEYLRTMIQH